MSYTRNDLFKTINNQWEAALRKGGNSNYSGKMPSMIDVQNSINAIPQIVAQGSNYVIQCTETANTTFTLSQNDTTIETKTNDAVKGGVVLFNVANTGIYKVTATQNNVEKWTKDIGVNDTGVIICKSPLSVDAYSEDEIDLAAKNHYAKYMWEIGDYKITDFTDTTDAMLKRRYIMSFDQALLSDGSGVAGITWVRPQTSSSFKMNNTDINNTSYEGSVGRALCLPSGSIQYVYDSTVTETTEGTYYTFDSVNESWSERTLPADYVSTEDYYTKTTTSANGEIWNTVPETLRNNLVSVKVKTWRGWTNNVPSRKAEDTKYLVSNDKVWIPSCKELFGNRYPLYNNGFGAYSNLDGETFEARNKFNYWEIIPYNSYNWTRSPSMSYSDSFANWFDVGYVNSIRASYSCRVAVALCQ